MTEKNGILRKSLIFLMIISMLLTLLSVPAAAKSKVRLSKTKLTITEGKSTTIKLTGTSKKAKWSVSGKKLVTIKTSGTKKHKAVIKAEDKEGTCYVKVKAGRKTLKCKITVKPAKQPEPDPEPEPIPEPDPFTKAVTDTSVSMLKYLSANENDKTRNILISPDSILTAMAMTENGAENNTLLEMETAFGGMHVDEFSQKLSDLNKHLTESKFVSYHIANSIWYKDNEDDIKVKESFIQKNKDLFDAEICREPFTPETVEKINNWVDQKTEGMIKKIIDDLSKDTVMLLINAIAFEGEWAEQYDEHHVSEQPFKNDDGTEQKTVSMLDGIENTYVNIGGADGFIKYYKGGEIAFLGLETPAGKTVDEFIQNLSGNDFVEGYYRRSHQYDVITKMPEFTYDYDESLVDTMKFLGIHSAFNELGYPAADFTGIAPPEQPLEISDVLHKTHIELDRNGTKAAAVTAVIMDKAASVPKQKDKINVNLDHPFVYAIIDTKTGIPLFIGTVKTV